VACGSFLADSTAKARPLELCLVSSSRLVLVRLGKEGSAGPGLLTVPGQAPRYAVGQKAALVSVFFLNLVLVVCATYSAAAPQGAFMGIGGPQYIYCHGGNSDCDYCVFFLSPVSFWVCMCSARLHLLTRPLGKKELRCSQSNSPTGRRFVLVSYWEVRITELYRYVRVSVLREL
jgi:hypothetical protein